MLLRQRPTEVCFRFRLFEGRRNPGPVQPEDDPDLRLVPADLRRPVSRPGPALLQPPGLQRGLHPGAGPRRHLERRILLHPDLQPEIQREVREGIQFQIRINELSQFA